jgi:uncharacterized protein
MAACPICKGPVPEDGEARPFCSSRCRLIDLGNWLGGRYRVPGEQHVDEQGTPAPPDDPKRDP